MKAYKYDKIKCQGIEVIIADIHYQDYYESVWDIEFTDINGVYRHWKQAYDGGEFIPATDRKYAGEIENGNVESTAVVNHNGVEYSLHTLGENGRAFFKYLVTCREPYIGRLFRDDDNAKRYAEGVIEGRFPAVESTYNWSYDDRFAYDMEV